MSYVSIVGGGLAGSEAAWQAAEAGCDVLLYEMRPQIQTGAHTSDALAELVCSNSLGSNLPDRASGLLKFELRRLGSLLVECAEAVSVPAGDALAVDRNEFSRLVTRKLSHHRRIRIIREEVTHIPEGICIIASGPLTSPHLAEAIQTFTGQERLFFYDAIAPIVNRDSIDFSIAFSGSRYNIGEDGTGDYINCPLDREQYFCFIEALKTAERIPLREFETDLKTGVRAGIDRYFESCLPVEIMAQRGDLALAYGPMRPVGLRNPRSGRRPFAVVQLRQDNLAGRLYNMVGFQTNLTYPEQRRVFRLIPGLEQVEFSRYGQMHRNTFIASPLLLLPTLQSRTRADLFFAGQITGVEGYMGNIATGLLAGLNSARLTARLEPLALPLTTMLGALCHYVTHAAMKDFQPMKANFGILPELNGAYNGKRARARAYQQRSFQDLDTFISTYLREAML
ncbi:MAG: methylenetetrahydrofolate--tRNA-(uracil(54)-C(5))-methyltransferase (FADH(2)-oxidizing) TrmFO [Chloroflexota bacterium]|jgi:methylenetetrahydrofolate--tRNA-(uracil-5-)-methyltransferase